MPQVVDGPDALSKEAQRNATLLFFSHLRATFASKRVLKEYKLTAEAFDWILGEVETRFNMVRDALDSVRQYQLLAARQGQCLMPVCVQSVPATDRRMPGQTGSWIGCPSPSPAAYHQYTSNAPCPSYLHQLVYML